ncbi:MAG TPA: nucleoside recognition domain-containing protein [Pseudomonadales bacterium]|nr:nucleoside recognition domain-containing protein [Pseudomonadales bacterium]
MIFLFPVVQGDRQTIVFGLLTDAARALFDPALDEMLAALLIVSALLTPLYPLLRDTAVGRNLVVKRWFDVHWVWTALRVAGGVAAAMVYFGFGPEIVRGGDTGFVVFHDICIAVMLVYMVSVFLMGLLTDYGLMEFLGALVQKPFTAAFRLPGRSAIDAVASLVSASGVGVLITIRQYELGRYTAREACAICTSFSIVSIPFALLISEVADIDRVFFSWYMTLIVACIVAAMVVARIGPVSRKADLLVDGSRPAGDLDELQGEGGALSRGFAAATARAGHGMSPGPYLRYSALQCGDLLLGILGPIMAIATLASIIVFRTPVFDVLAMPIGWALELGGFPEAHAAAKGFVVGLLDQFMPALVAQNLDSEYARFVLGGLSVAQLIYFSEYGMLMLRSPLPITIGDLVITFVLRTLVVTPVIMLGGALIL